MIFIVIGKHMDKKYELASELCTINGVSFYRVKALRAFGRIRAGDLGGLVQHKDNLSQGGSCWISKNVRVYGTARVYGNACIFGNVCVYDAASVYGNARVFGNACIYGEASVYGDVRIYDSAQVYNIAEVYDNAKVYGTARVFGSAWVYGSAKVYENAEVYGQARVYEYATVYGNAKVFGNCEVCGNAYVCRNAQILPHAKIYSGVINGEDKLYSIYGPVGSRNGYMTINGSNNDVSCGCFRGSIDHFKKTVISQYGEEGRFAKAYLDILENYSKKAK